MQRPPVSFYLVTSLFLLQGLYGAYRGLSEWADGRIYLPLDVVCIFIGFGLLKHRNGWRKFAVGLLWFEVILGSVIFTWFIVAGKHATINGRYPAWLPDPVIVVSLAFALGCLTSLAALWVLTSKKVTVFFQEEGENLAAHGSAKQAL